MPGRPQHWDQLLAARTCFHHLHSSSGSHSSIGSDGRCRDQGGDSIALQVGRAVEVMLGDEEGEAEQMVAVLDARQATTLQVTRKVNLIKKLALDLNQVSVRCCAPVSLSQLQSQPHQEACTRPQSGQC